MHGIEKSRFFGFGMQRFERGRREPVRKEIHQIRKEWKV